MKELTKAEEQIMQVLWLLEEGVVRDVINELPDPKPAYNTVSTIIRILEKKEFVTHKAIGKTHVYFPLVSKDTYRQFKIRNFKKSYFGDKAKSMLSYFIENEDLDLKEIDEILALIQKKKKKS